MFVRVGHKQKMCHPLVTECLDGGGTPSGVRGSTAHLGTGPFLGSSLDSAPY